MKNKISNSVLLSFVLIIFSLHNTYAQSEDTILNMVLSKPYFYNIINVVDGKVYAGTSEGIFEIIGKSISQYGSKPGYITTDKSGLPNIDSNGIGTYKERKYLHLLPYPEIVREEYHANGEGVFYICSGGRLYIFDLVEYNYSYPNHSLRTISKDLIGTYSGIYYKGKKLISPIPNFTDGYIRQFGDRTFICNYELIALEKDALETGVLKKGKNYFTFQLPSPVFFNDIFESIDKNNYYIISGKGLIRTNYHLSADTMMYINKYNYFQNILISENPYELYFTDKNKLLVYNYSNGKLDELCELKEPILGGIFSDNQLYLITNKGLYRKKPADGLEKILDIEKSHSILKISGSELIISSDYGLYYCNVVSRTISILIPGIEFNRYALYKNGEKIYAGSVNGLYTINERDLPFLIEKNKTQIKLSSSNNNFKNIILVISIFFIILILILLLFRKKLKTAEKIIQLLEHSQEKITREKIEDYISTHLATISIKTIIEHFNTNGPALYEIFKPEKPGTVIHQQRLKLLKKMRVLGNSLDDISKATGFSISYIKKLKP